MDTHDLPHRIWMRGLRALGAAMLHSAYDLEIEGRENVPAGGALVIANHSAFHDWLFVGVAMPRRVRFVMHQHHFRYPLLRAFFTASRVIPIAPSKEDGAALARAMDAIDAALGNGELVMIFPEGTMTSNGELSPFRPGLERIVAKRPVPIVPVGVTGLWGSWFSRAAGAPMHGAPHWTRRQVRIRIGAPLTPAIEPGSRRSLHEVSIRARAAIEALTGGATKAAPQIPSPASAA
jgi:hypothetical protein